MIGVKKLKTNVRFLFLWDTTNRDKQINYFTYFISLRYFYYKKNKKTKINHFLLKMKARYAK